MGTWGDIKSGISLGRKARKLFTEIRNNAVDPWDAIEPGSPYYDRMKQFKEEYPLFEYIGVIIGQLMHPKEWYLNADYLFRD